MAKFKADADDANYVQSLLNEDYGLPHLRTRHRADTVVVESGPKNDPVLHVRLRRVGVHLWIFDIADHRGRWEPTGIRTNIEAGVKMLVDNFGWVLTAIDDEEET